MCVWILKILNRHVSNLIKILDEKTTDEEDKQQKKNEEQINSLEKKFKSLMNVKKITSNSNDTTREKQKSTLNLSKPSVYRGMKPNSKPFSLKERLNKELIE